jgi:hypothetical protein
MLAIMPATALKYPEDPRVYFSATDDRIGFVWADRYQIVRNHDLLEWTFSHQTDTAGRPLYSASQEQYEIEFRFRLNDAGQTVIQLRFQDKRWAARDFEAALSAHTGGRRGRFVPSTLPPYWDGDGGE